MAYYNKNNKKNNKHCCLPQKKGPVYIKCINGLIQYREKDCRLATGDDKQGQGLCIPPKERYCYAGKILDSDCQVVETFANKTTNRLCLIDAYQQATQKDHTLYPPRWCLFDPKTGRRLYEIATDVDGNKVLCIVDECNFNKRLVNTQKINYRTYDCIVDDKGRYWRLERRDIKGPKTVKKRLLVKESCNGFCLPETGPCCCNDKQKRSLIYEQRKAHCLSKTKYACNQPPSINRVS